MTHQSYEKKPLFLKLLLRKSDYKQRVFMIQCSFGLFYALYFAIRFSQNYNYIASHFCGHMCNAVQCSLKFSQNHNRTAPHFCGYMCDVTYKMQFETSIFFKFWVFLTQPKTYFSLCFGQNFKLLSQFFSILG